MYDEKRLDILDSSSVSHNERISSVEPRVTEIEERVALIDEQTPIIHETKAVVPIIHSNENRIGVIEKKIIKLRDIDPIKKDLTKFKYVYSELTRIDPIEMRMEKCENTLEGVSDLPELRTRLSTLETAPLEGDGALISNISLSHVLSCCNETDASIKTRGGRYGTRILYRRYTNYDIKTG